MIVEGMKRKGFSDLKHAAPISVLVGKADADMVHETVSLCHVEFFDTYLKCVKEEPKFKNSRGVVVEKF